MDVGARPRALAARRRGRGRRARAARRRGRGSTRRFGPSTATVTLRAARRVSRASTSHVELDWHHDEHLLSMAFPLDVRADTATCDIQFGAVRRPTHAVDVVGRRQVRGLRPPLRRRRRARLRRRRAQRRPLRPRRVRRRGAGQPGCAPPSTPTRRRPRPPRGDARAAPARRRPRRRASPRPSALDLAAAGRRRRRSGRGSRRAPVVTRRPARGVEVDAVKLADDGAGDLVVRLHEACGDRRRVDGARRPADHRGAAAATCSRSRSAGVEVGDGIVALDAAPVRAGDAAPDRADRRGATGRSADRRQPATAGDAARIARRTAAMPSTIASSSK